MDKAHQEMVMKHRVQSLHQTGVRAAGRAKRDLTYHKAIMSNPPFFPSFLPNRAAQLGHNSTSILHLCMVHLSTSLTPRPTILPETVGHSTYVSRNQADSRRANNRTALSIFRLQYHGHLLRHIPSIDLLDAK
jgi:hypothetical protein